jgi:hypothetical protein
MVEVWKLAKKIEDSEITFFDKKLRTNVLMLECFLREKTYFNVKNFC